MSALAAAGALLLDPVLALVFPSRCPGCGAAPERPTRGPLCGPCWARLPRHRDGVCTCGRPLSAAGEGPCGRCRRGLSPFEAGASLGPYEGTLRALLHDLKYRGRRRLAGRLAEALLTEAAVRRVLAGDVVLVPVPLHPRKRRERGFNQAELLARELARRAGRELCAGALVRRVDTPPQAGLAAGARRRNVAGVFAVRQRGRFTGRSVVLVDDVLTTGATAVACARALAGGGARAVRLLTVARVV
jgi:ComF family protein